jgi:acetyltransferase
MSTYEQLLSGGQKILTSQGRAIAVRPAGPADEEKLFAMFSQCTAEDLRLRSLGAIKDFARLIVPRLCRPKCEGEFALVAELIDPNEPGAIIGVVHLVTDPREPKTAEFDIMIRSDHKGEGVGFELLKAALAVADEHGLATIIGYVLHSNTNMLQMTHEFGFRHTFVGGDVVLVKRMLA